MYVIYKENIYKLFQFTDWGRILLDTYQWL